MAGWVRWYRDAEVNPVLEDAAGYDKTHAFLWMVMRANFKRVYINVDGKRKRLNRGQFFTSIRKLAAAWGWGPRKVSKYLDDLETNGMITRKRYHGGTIITVENYSKYQDSCNTNGHTSEHVNEHANEHANGTQDNKIKETVAEPRNRGPLPLEEVDPRYLDLPMGEPDVW